MKVLILYLVFTFSLESPFRKILDSALKHEKEEYECPVLSNDCPFGNKQFIKRIKLGQKEPKEFMDEMMDTVISDLREPLENKKYDFQVNFTSYLPSTNVPYNLLSFITGIFIVINMIFVINYAFGIGKKTKYQV